MDIACDERKDNAMTYNFYVGQKVVCIYDRKPVRELEPGESVPAYNDVVTVREILVPPWSRFVELRFIEHRNPIVTIGRYTGEATFDAHWFRPVIERKTDISIFQKMLLPTKEREPA